MSKVTDFANHVLAEVSAGRDLDFRAIREEIHALSEFAEGEAERVSLLQIFHIIMDAMEAGGDIDTRNIESFRKVRDESYHLLLTREIMVGVNASVGLADRVTAREIAAGRMKETDPLRLAVNDALEKPYPTVEELRQMERGRIARAAGTKRWPSWFSRG